VKREANPSGSGGRLRLALLIASAAAFLLVPIASASAANPPASVVFEGSGSGWVKGEGELAGNPPLECHWNGETQKIDVDMPPGSGKCETETVKGESFTGQLFHAEEDPGSVFVEWELISADLPIGCEELTAPYCGIVTFVNPIEVKAIFEEIPPPLQPLNLTASGAPGGEFECSINGGPAGPCSPEVGQGKNIEVFATGTGVELNEWTTGPCEGTNSNPCSFTMPSEAVSANAEFSVASEELTVNKVGEEGTVECQVNGGGFAPCVGPASYEYGDEIEVKATAEAEHKLVSLEGTGSAAGAACEVESETEGSCAFTITANSSVTAEFEPAGTKAQTPATVEGEVPITTSLKGCESPVVLGPFVPTVAFNYEGTCSLTATSTGVETELSAADGSAEETGHLVQEYEDKNHVIHHYRLPSALETRANGLAGLEFPGTSYPYAPLTEPVTLLTYAAPVSADDVTVHFKQHIGLHDALHTGTYAKTITLTLEQTTP
jgi:hypothetical protein